MNRFEDRREAGRKLAKELAEYEGQGDVMVLGLLRGGVPVGYEISESLAAPLDVLIVRKLGLPSNQEVAFGIYITCLFSDSICCDILWIRELRNKHKF